MTRVGVVGLGAMGAHHVRVYRELGCDIAGVVDADPTRAGEIGHLYAVPGYTSCKPLLEAGIDAVSIAVPTSLHKSVALEFLSAGIHCLVEKPIASTLEEAQALIDAARHNSVKLMVGHIERFNPAVLKLKEIIEEGVLGKVIIISTRRVGPFQPRIRDVGIIIDSATHDIDVVRFLTGREPVNIYSKAGRIRHPSREDHALIMLDFGDAAAAIEVNWFTPYKERKLVVTGTEAICYLGYISQKLWVNTTQSQYPVEVKAAEPLKTELAHFLHCIHNDTEPLVNGHEGLENLKVAIQACEKVSHVPG